MTMIDRNEVMALAEEFRKFDRLGVRVPMDSCAQMIEALAAKANANSPALADLREMAQRLRTEFNMPGTAARIEESALVLETSLAAKAEPKPDGWYCPHCEATVPPEHVTFTERHDERQGGCGMALDAKAEPQGGEVDDDRAALLYLMHQFDGEVHVCPCGREDPTGDCDSAIYLREYLRTHPAPKPAEGEGWVLVPVEPTAEMLVAGFLSDSNGFTIEHPSDAPDLVYRAMLAAAPKKGEGNG